MAFSPGGSPGIPRGPKQKPVVVWHLEEPLVFLGHLFLGNRTLPVGLFAQLAAGPVYALWDFEECQCGFGLRQTKWDHFNGYILVSSQLAFKPKGSSKTHSQRVLS